MRVGCRPRAFLQLPTAALLVMITQASMSITVNDKSYLLKDGRTAFHVKLRVPPWRHTFNKQQNESLADFQQFVQDVADGRKPLSRKKPKVRARS